MSKCGYAHLIIPLRKAEDMHHITNYELTPLAGY